MSFKVRSNELPRTVGVGRRVVAGEGDFILFSRSVVLNMLLSFDVVTPKNNSDGRFWNL